VRATSSEKCDSACHISENTQSDGLWGISKQKQKYKDLILKKKVLEAKPKVSYITGGK